MRLNKYEQETIINFNQGEQKAYIYTCSKPWMRHMEKTLGLKPVKLYGRYAKGYELPKSWIRKPLKPRQLSESERKKLANRLIQTSILRSETACAVGKSGGVNGNQ